MNTYKPEGSFISSQKNFEYISSITGLERALERQIILEGSVVLCDHELNLHVDLPAKIKGIIPREEVLWTNDGQVSKDIAILTRVGKTVCFKVIGFKKNIKGDLVAILSRRAAQEECYHNYICGLIPGDIIHSKVTHLDNFGAFVDIGCGIISLLSIDCISVSRITHPSERLSVGDSIYTVVKGADTKGRLFVSLRELLGTWEENAALFREGDTVSGIIRSVENYGIFVELTPNLAGLAEFRANIYSGQTAAVYIKSILPDKMKIKLIIIDAYDNAIFSEGLNYFIDTSTVSHINNWTYSPNKSKKIIESIFAKL